MNGYQEGAITGGIAKGINTAMSGILQPGADALFDY